MLHQEYVALFPFPSHTFKEQGKSVNKVCILIINCHSVNKFKIEGLWFVFKTFYNISLIFRKNILWWGGGGFA